ncbi:hypothetical protein AV530_018201 [Patagioenas fasciata monilis]|uniref:Uncharacterized protein n=1 Tax=Patagioenas fasciata monilis TaxID=372326 RepID=A0A1V4KL67_PATFA|nr:hypothetical protein AV530_018201 [Patagioenas fasciata monilis]
MMRSRATNKRKDAEDPREEGQELQLLDWYVHESSGFRFLLSEKRTYAGSSGSSGRGAARLSAGSAIQICLSRCFGLLWRRCPTPAVAPLQTALRAGDEQRQGSPASLLPSPGGSLSSSRGELQTTKK